jgi:uncharacterized protein (TIGR02145 family)
LPSNREWNELVYAVGGSGAGNKLKAATGWKSGDNGTNDYGFSALPGGYRHYNQKFIGFYGAINNGYWWTATEGGSKTAYIRTFYNGVGYVELKEIGESTSHGYSVRCVKDD